MRRVALALVLAAAPARAESITEPFVGLAVEQLYDSNVMNSRGPDAVTRVSPHIGVLIDTRRWRIETDYRLSLHEYLQGTADGSVNHRAALIAKLRATPRLELGADATLLVGSDPVLLDRPGVAIPQGAFVDLAAGLGESYRLTRRATLLSRYSYRRSRFDLAQGPTPLAFDGDEHRLDAEGDYRLSRVWTGRLLVRGQHFVSFGSTTNLGNAIGAGPGLEWRLSERTHVRVSGGPVWFTEGGAGFFAGGDLVRTGERWRIALRALHDLYGGTSAAEAVWSESLLVDGTVRLFRNLGLRARAGGYRSGVAPHGPTDVSGLLGGAYLGWAVSHNLRFDLYAEHRAQDANGGTAFNSLQRTFIGLRIVATVGTDLSSIGDLP